ncbi:MAG TPA: hypothetical protein VGN72_05040 [Tepidisphaeraceae bacterium]|jgi:hypothetical protein|nr:hypothetical protein [Tepidisphaeraceae bacterium]
MTPKKRMQLAMTAAMEGQQTVVANIGAKVEVSQMELVCLVNFAEVGLMSLFSALDGEAGAAAEADLERTLDAIRQEFGKDGADGLNRLSQSTAALLRGEKFAQYLAR